MLMDFSAFIIFVTKGFIIFTLTTMFVHFCIFIKDYFIKDK